MKVLAFADFPSPYRVEVFKGLNEHYDLTVFFDKTSDQNRNSKWFCKNTGLHSYNLFESEGQAVFDCVLRNLRHYDLVLAYDYHIKNALRLQFCCMWQHVPYIINLDGAFIRRNLIKNLIKRIIIMGAAGYFASGKKAAEYFTHFGAKLGKIYYHPFTSLHETDILDAPVCCQDKGLLRQKMNLKDRKTVLAIGQFIPRKGFDVLINAWGEFDKEYQLIIIGGGKDKVEYEKLILEKEYQHVQLIDFLPKEKVFQYYSLSDIFVLPTREDIWGLVLNEAMAYGLPVITTNMCLAADELIENGENGYIVPVEDVHALADAMKKILKTEKYDDMAKKGLAKIKEYTYENVVRAHVTAINQIMHL